MNKQENECTVTKSQVKKIVAFVSYYRKYIQNFMEYAKQIDDLMRKE